MSIEFEHFIGVNTIQSGVIFHPNGENYIFSNGTSVIIGDLLDSHKQQFLKKHDDFVTCLAVSQSGKLIASGQLGDNSDIYVWDFEMKCVIYKFEEHDHKIQAIAFSDDERILATIGNSDDDKLIVWDLSNGCIIASAYKLPVGTTCLSFGGFVRDIKRRDTNHYLLCTAGIDGLVIWDLDPFSGDLVPQKIVAEARATMSRQVTAVAFSDDKEFIYAATTSGDYIVASMRSKKIVQAVQATRMSTNSILSLNDGEVILGCGDNSVKLYDANGEFKSQIQVDGSVTCLSLSPDKLEVLSLTSVGTITRINLNSLQHIIISESHTSSIVQIAFDQGFFMYITCIYYNYLCYLYSEFLLSYYYFYATVFLKLKLKNNDNKKY
jgi:WD40 repeat protein